jgi:hypothetical protein
MPPQQPSEHNPYDFITNPKIPVKKMKATFSGGSSTQKRIAIVIALVIVLLTAFIVINSIISNSKKGNFPQMLIVVEDQSELSHITSQAQAQATNQVTKNVSATIQITINSAQSELTAIIAKNGHKISTAMAAAGHSASIDTQLKNANDISNFDPVYLQVLQQTINKYQQDIKNAAPGATKNERTILVNDYNGANLLNTQITAAINNIP